MSVDEPERVPEQERVDGPEHFAGQQLIHASNQRFATW